MAANQPIPIFTNLADAFQDNAVVFDQAQRWDKLVKDFEEHYGIKPTYIVRAPGRVNLIGEHIDYALFGVFPAAIERDVLIAVAPRLPAPSADEDDEEDDPGRVTAENQERRYARQTFAPVLDEHGEWQLDIDKEQLRWESYVKAGYYGVLERFFNGHTDCKPQAADLLVTGSVPPGSGLSSSSAMVVASTLSFLVANDKLQGLSKGDLVRMAVVNERRVGVNTGGMDQSASVIAQPISALYVSFFPSLSAVPVPLPLTSPRSVFVCANSLVVSDKVVHAKSRYNLRVVETLVAARVLARRLGVAVGDEEKVTLREVLGRWVGEGEGEDGVWNEKSEKGEEEWLKGALGRARKGLDGLKLVDGDGSAGEETGVTLKEMIEMSGLEPEKFKKVYLSWVDVEATRFQLYNRTKHVFSEAWRVLEFRDICIRSSSTTGALSEAQSEEVLQALGKLMNESQDSCANLFECSCHELDTLTRLAREAGAYGSRLTGAGWGGCTVSLVAEDRVDEFIAHIKKHYSPYHGLQGEQLKEVIFPTKPSVGAFVFKMT